MQTEKSDTIKPGPKHITLIKLSYFFPSFFKAWFGITSKVLQAWWMSKKKAAGIRETEP